MAKKPSVTVGLEEDYLGTTGDDIYFHGNGKGRVFGGDGHDTLSGGNGKDELNGDAGDDILSGGNAKDLLNGGAGSDILNGGIGKDTLFGGDDADIFVFDGNGLKGGTDTIKDFVATTSVTTTDPETGTETTVTTLGDVLELHDLLQGYDALTSNLSDFVRLTEVGGNTVVSVDRNGAEKGEKFMTLVTLEGVTGLDEATVIAAGNITVS